MNTYQTRAAYQQIGTEESTRKKAFEIGHHDVEMLAAPRGEDKRDTGLPAGLKAMVALLVLLCGGLLIANVTGNAHSQPVAAAGSNGVAGGIIPGPSVEGKTSDSALFDKEGRYILHDYDTRKPMSNFLAGLGGFWGVPMWAFYVNRGQGLTCFGIQNKDQPIAKFSTAEKAYQETPFTGFRTFVKGEKDGKSFEHMPFFPTTNSKTTTRDMKIGMNEMEIEEVAKDIGLQTNVLYYTVPLEDFPHMVRKTTFSNLDDSEELSLEVLDGLAHLIPSGLGNTQLDSMGRTMEAWMNVYNMPESENTLPFFHISQGTADTSTVQIIKDGHFAVAFIEDDDASEGDLHEPLPFVVDPTLVFETDTTLTNPSGFFGDDVPELADYLAQEQGFSSRTPCAFTGATVTIPPGKSVTIISVYGHAADVDEFEDKHSPKVRAAGYTQKARKNAKDVVKAITDKVTTKTGSELFNKYVEQDFLDNVLRGGLPTMIGSGEDAKVYHTFSRIHGDLERDYNYFQIEPTYFSQGPGNFRDVNQNRRMDLFHTPEVGDFNIRMFLSFCQADGFNPLTVATTNLRVPADKIDSVIEQLQIPQDHVKVMKSLIGKAFRIGQLFDDMKKDAITPGVDRETVLEIVASAATQEFAAQFAQNGFWADHWTYTLDLVDNFVSIYPDKEEDLLYDAEPVPFYMSPAVVKARADRYTLVDDPDDAGEKTIRVMNAIAGFDDADFPPLRKAALQTIWGSSSFIGDTAGAGGVWQRTSSGSVMTVSPLAKFVILGMLKFSSLDPEGMGVEMEGGKPGWNDAMNGLPGIVGSGMPETYEMMRIVRYTRDSIKKFDKGVSVPGEFGIFVRAMKVALDKFKGSAKDKQAEFDYWDESNNAREAYRAATIVTFTGATEDFDADYLVDLLTDMEEKSMAGVKKAVATTKSGMSPSYFYYECTDYEVVGSVWGTQATSGSSSDTPKVKAKAFKRHTLPIFLEGPTRHLKVVETQHERKMIYDNVYLSKMYDSKLNMYMICESLKSMSQDIGRMMAFSPGWLENQSIWLHMSYKYYLEILRAGLYEQFFTEIKSGLVPFMDNEVYGRSPLEASSFIVSSAFPDSRMHGQGFLARLSGSTAEFLSMWALMVAGPTPFVLTDDDTLALKLSPILPSWLFTDKGTVEFSFLGSVPVTYHNPDGGNTWEMTVQNVKVTLSDGTVKEFEGGDVDEETSLAVRDKDVKKIDVYY
jgi:hypothetical protein